MIFAFDGVDAVLVDYGLPLRIVMTRMHNPLLSGEILGEYLGNVTVSEAAERLHVTRAALSRVLNARAGASADFGLPPGRCVWNERSTVGRPADSVRLEPSREHKAPAHRAPGNLEPSESACKPIKRPTAPVHLVCNGRAALRRLVRPGAYGSRQGCGLRREVR